MFFNGYPLVFFDSNQYVTRWAGGVSSLDRPIGYFIWLGVFAHLPVGVTVAVFAQCLLVCALCWRASTVHGQTGRGRRFWLMVLIIAVSPSAVWLCALMPDFAVWGIPLSVTLLESGLPLAAGVLLSFVVVSVHFLNLPLFAITLGVTALFGWRLSAASWRRSVRCAACWAVGAVVASVGNAAYNRVPLSSSPSVIFVAARLHESGVLEPMLKDACAAHPENRRLCRFHDGMLSIQGRDANGLLWDDRSPLRAEWPAWETDPTEFRNASMFLQPLVRGGLMRHYSAFWRSGVRNVLAMAAGNYPLTGVSQEALEFAGPAFARLGPREVSRLTASRQADDWWPHSLLAAATSGYVRAAVAACVFGLLFLFSWWLSDSALVLDLGTLLALACLTVFMANLWLTCFISREVSRYIERVAALPAIGLVFIPWQRFATRVRTAAIFAVLPLVSMAAVNFHFGIVLGLSALGGTICGAYTRGSARP
jgi:hypothetical protein